MSQNEFERVSFVKIKHLAVYMTKLKNRSFHMHDELELLCVTKGHCNVKTFNKTVEARRGSVVLLNRDTAHSMETLDGEYTEYVVIQIAGNFLSEYCQQIRNSYFLENDVTSTMTIEQKATLWQTVFNLAYCYNQANANFELDCINYSAQLFKILLQCVPYKTLSQNDVTTQKKLSLRVNNVVNYLAENYKYKPSLCELAESQGITPTHLSHFFKQYFGKSYQEYLNDLRFENALRLISNKKMTLFDVAMHSGFSDVKYMTDCFKSKLNCTPKQFRQRAMNSPSVEKSEYSLTEYRFSREEEKALLLSSVAPLGQKE